MKINQKQDIQLKHIAITAFVMSLLFMGCSEMKGKNSDGNKTNGGKNLKSSLTDMQYKHLFDDALDKNQTHPETQNDNSNPEETQQEAAIFAAGCF